ncbi:hypothetical protein RZS08_61140, partial [Arthrospira platensis SPKY1]|nr:hypothetical protein [Arthrospira platensis SPKY1]
MVAGPVHSRLQHRRDRAAQAFGIGAWQGDIRRAHVPGQIVQGRVWPVRHVQNDTRNPLTSDRFCKGFGIRRGPDPVRAPIQRDIRAPIRQ